MITLFSQHPHSDLLFAHVDAALARAGVESSHMRMEEYESMQGVIDAIPRGGALVVWNGMEQRQIIETAQICGMRIAYCEHGCIPHTTAIDPMGVNARSSVAGLSASFLARIPIDEEKMTALASRPLFQRELPKGVESTGYDDGLPLPASFVLLILQVYDDSQIKLLSPHYHTMGQLIDDVARATAEIGIGLVIKAHSSDAGRADYLQRVRLYKHAQIRLTDSVEYLLSFCAHGVITINSGVGAEAMLRGHNVLVLGEAVYSPVCLSVLDGDTLTDAVRSLLKSPQATDFQRRWLYYMYHHYLLPVWCFDPDADGCDAAARRLVDISEGKLPWLTDIA